MAHRTFLALDLDEAIRDRIVAAQRQMDCGAVKLKWVEPENLHVTLKFLGDVEDALLHEVLDLTAAAAAGVEAFEFDVRGVLAVPPQGRLRMLWVGVQDLAGRMAALYRGLDQAMAALPIHQEERGFRPHVTLARIKFAANPAPLRRSVGQFADEDFGVQHAEEVVAYTSELTQDGPVYTPMARAPLGR